MVMYVCSTPGCPTLTPTSGHCGPCKRLKDQTRGTTTQRGYGATHRQLRAQYQARMDQGETFTCWRHGDHTIDPTNWHLGHDDNDRTIYRGPECPTGNQATRARQDRS